MDPITQGLFGASVAVAVTPKDKMRHAAVVGALAGLAPDLDVFFLSDDSMGYLRQHRGITHALWFVPVGAVALSALLWPWLRKHMSVWALLGYAGLGWLSHAPLDACTSFGTPLLAPFSDTRLAWDVVAVIDPAFSLLLLIGLVWALVARQRRAMRWGLGLAVGYLGLGLLLGWRAEALMLDEISRSEPQASITRWDVKPTLGQLIVWRGLFGDASDPGQTRGCAVSINVITGAVSSPSCVPLYQVPEIIQGTPLAPDLKFYRRFTEGWWFALDPDESSVTRLADLRYGFPVASARPIWWIAFDVSRPGQPPRFVRAPRPSFTKAWKQENLKVP